MQLKKYLKKQGHGSQIKLAKAIGAHSPDVSDWSNGFRRIPFDKAVAIEAHTKGLVTRKELCVDWQKIWPELANS